MSVIGDRQDRIVGRQIGGDGDACRTGTRAVLEQFGQDVVERTVEQAADLRNGFGRNAGMNRPSPLPLLSSALVRPTRSRF